MSNLFIISLNFTHAPNLARLRYVSDFLENHPLCQGRLRLFFNTPLNATLNIDYQSITTDTRINILIRAQQLLFGNGVVNHRQLYANKYLWKSHILYSVEPEQRAVQPFLQDKVIQFDILETIFFHISRYEEWHCSDAEKDQWDKLEEGHHFLVANGLEQSAVVDWLVSVFLEVTNFGTTQLATQFRITHDIDAVIKFKNLGVVIRASAGLLLRGKGIKACWRLWSSNLATLTGRQPDPFDTFDWMLNDNIRNEKVIYFLAGGQTKFDKPFNLNSPRMKEIFTLCKERGYIIGLHPSYATWNHQQLMANELEHLSKVVKQDVKHSRQHYLHFSFQHTPYQLEVLGIAEDSSLGFNNRIGFRCGTGFLYQLYDFKNERAFKFLEVPLVLMDSALLRQGNYEAKRIQQIFNDFLTANAHNTFITFNFHNSRFDDAWIHGIPLREMYEQISNPATLPSDRIKA